MLTQPTLGAAAAPPEDANSHTADASHHYQVTQSAMVTVVSGEGDEFTIPMAAACQSRTIRDMLQGLAHIHQQ